MMHTELHIPASMYEKAVGHLFSSMDTEHAAFLYARVATDARSLVLSAEGYHLVPRDGFVRQSAYHFELRDDVQRHVIQEAHGRGGCLVEMHSHPFPAPACFSTTDVLGLADWAPHVRWRLGGRPYAALVVAPGSFDGLVFSAGETPALLSALVVNGTAMRPTGFTAHNWEALNNG